MDTNFLPMLLLILFAFVLSISVADVNPNPKPMATNTACNATLYPTFCKSMLPHNNKTSNIRDYSRFSLRRSLSAAKRFLSLIDKYLSQRLPLSKTAIRALEDCRFLGELNFDFLLSTMKTLNSTKPILNDQTDELLTLLSAIVTNQQTCSDGIEATASSWSLKGGLYTPLSNGTKLYSVSLSLVTRGWLHKKKKCKSSSCEEGRMLYTKRAKYGPLPLNMTDRIRTVYESASGRKFRRESSDDVLVKDIVVVSLNGTGNFTSINDAVAAAPNNTVVTDGYFLIYVTAGVYEEYVSIGKNKKYLMMIGDGINQTVITGNRSFIDGWTTFNSATFAVVGEGFMAVNITFRNTAGAIKHQAVAVRNGADLSTFYTCSFEGYQDTLYTHSLRQFYRQCDIYGTVDFIFGNAAVVFQNCNIYARLCMSNQFNAVTAQGRSDPFQNTGIAIQNCTIMASPELAKSNRTVMTYLGRPWKEYSRTVYMRSYMDDLISPPGWTPWEGDFALNTSYYVEFNNKGPGSKVKQRITWKGHYVFKNATEMANFTVSSFIMGDEWIPATGVPYTVGF